nr:ATP synthase F0 subunit 6 [Candidula unifasciata unifasciata]
MMLTDLFSSLDGAYTYLMWLPPFVLIYLLFCSSYLNSTISVLINSSTSVWVEKINKRYLPFPALLTTLFLLLLMTNFMGLTPLTYTLSSDLFAMSTLAVTLWLLLLLSGYMYAPLASLAHLAPSGAPLALTPFLVLIETVSILIRPLTLTVRLMANISAGHIVLGLVANSLTTLVGNIFLIPVLLLSTGYMLFEFFVCIIQAYIFTLLISLYQTEHP